MASAAVFLISSMDREVRPIRGNVLILGQVRAELFTATELLRYCLSLI